MFRKLLSYLGKYKKTAILAMFCVSAEVAFELVIPFIMADIVDVGVATGDRAYILAKGAMMLLCALIALGLGIGSAYFSAVAGQGLGAELRKAEYKKIQSFSFANTDKFRTSSLITRLTSDITTIQNSFSTGLRPACRAPIMMIMGLGLSIYINWQLALVFFVGAPVLGILLFLIIRKVRPLYAKMQGAIDLVNRVIQENLTAIRVVKAYV
ncbi:MAG TPA: ABC transporter, partial [Lachnospiraceae bacterium]|nr:ABC transporter [Lachnospiraceae bacterium]